MNPTILALVAIALAILINKYPAMAEHKDNLNILLLGIISGVWARVSNLHAARKDNVKEIQSALSLPQTGKVTSDVGIAIANAIATQPSQAVRDKALDAAVAITENK